MSFDAAARAIADAVERAEGRLPPKKRALIEAAVTLFAERGFDATSTRAIADRAGVAEATIFRHFPTKKDLLLRLVEPVAAQIIVPNVETEADALLADNADLPGFVSAVMHSRLAFADQYAPLIRIILQELPINAELRAVVTRHLGGAILRIADLRLGELARAGHVRDIPPARLIRWLISLLVGYYATRSILAPGDGWDDDAEVAAMVEMLSAGVLVPDAGPGGPGS